MKTIWKVTIKPDQIGKVVEFQLPEGAEFLNSARRMGDEVALWVYVDSDKPLVTRRLVSVGTGWELPDGAGHYLGTVFQESILGLLVFHILEVPA